MVIRHAVRRKHRSQKLYRITDSLHTERTALVPGSDIATTVSAWLAELGIHTPLVDDLASAVRSGDWASAYAIGEYLSVLVIPVHRRGEPGQVSD